MSTLEPEDNEPYSEEEEFRRKLVLESEKENLIALIKSNLSLTEQASFYSSIRIIERANRETLMFLLTRAYFDLYMRDKQIKNLLNFMGPYDETVQ